jgi:hypothetical protein
VELKGPVTNVHKRLKKMYSVIGVNKSTVSRRAEIIEGSEEDQAEYSDMRRSAWP